MSLPAHRFIWDRPRTVSCDFHSSYETRPRCVVGERGCLWCRRRDRVFWFAASISVLGHSGLSFGPEGRRNPHRRDVRTDTRGSDGAASKRQIAQHPQRGVLTPHSGRSPRPRAVCLRGQLLKKAYRWNV